jgi:hypothetical protein
VVAKEVERVAVQQTDVAHADAVSGRTERATLPSSRAQALNELREDELAALPPCGD